MPTASSRVPVLTEDGRLPDEYAPPSVAADAAAASTARTGAETARDAASTAAGNAAASATAASTAAGTAASDAVALTQEVIAADVAAAQTARTGAETARTAAEDAAATLQPGQAGGVAQLDAGARVPDAQLPARLGDTELGARIVQSVGEEVEGQDIPGRVAAAVAAAPTVVAAATAAVDQEIEGRDLVEAVPGFPEGAAGGLIGENGRATDLLVDANGDLIDDALDRWAPRLEDRGLLGSESSEWYGGGLVGENDRLTELVVDQLGRIPADVLAAWAARMPPVADAASMAQVMAGPDILTIGDSLTASGNIATRLATLTGRTVRNMGVGGESTTGIMARLGAWPMLLTIPAGQIPATGSTDVTFVSSYKSLAFWPLLQGSGVREGDTYLWGTIKGVRVRLSIRVKDPEVAYPAHGAGDVYQITRAADGVAVPVTRPEPFLPEHGGARSGDIIVAWIGQNGPSDDATFCATQAIEQWATKAGARFLFLTAPGPVSTGWTALEDRMLDRWGRRFVNVRRFLIDEALGVMGLTPTATDLDDIAAGRVPTQLRTDSVHHTAAAQQAIAEHLIYPRLTELRMV